MNLKELAKVIDQIAEEKKIDSEKVLEIVEASIAAAYRREYGHKGMVVKATLDLNTGETEFYQIKTVEDETTVKILSEEEIKAEEEARAARGQEGEKGMAPTSVPTPAPTSEVGVQVGIQVGVPPTSVPTPEVGIQVGVQGGVTEDEEGKTRYNPDRHILIEEARKIKPEAAVGEEISFPLPKPEADFGRIAAQTAKQNILQRLREVERTSVMEEFKDREGRVVSGIVRRFERGSVYVDLGRTEGVMFRHESIPGEHYRIGERLKFLVTAVQDELKGPSVVLSRNHPRFISKLFENEVPEIADRTVEIKGIAREAGSRTKIAVVSNDAGIDAVGSFVGQRGTRVMSVNNEVGQEKIDIIEWSDDPETYVANALSPAKVTGTEVGERREVRVFVPEDQLSLAIGRGGQNVRLAAKLTGFKIDVRSILKPEEQVEGGVVAEETELKDESQESVAPETDTDEQTPSAEKKEGEGEVDSK